MYIVTWVSLLVMAWSPMRIANFSGFDEDGSCCVGLAVMHRTSFSVRWS